MQSLLKIYTHVRRACSERRLAAEELVPGDVVHDVLFHEHFALCANMLWKKMESSILPQATCPFGSMTA